MTSAQHAAWIKAGSPAQLARPLDKLTRRLRGYGYTVYWIGNDSHLDHQPPEDHTPYSATGWPIATAYGWVTAVDIMPPPTGSGLPSLAALAAQIRADRIAGLPAAMWLKYINWEPGDGTCWHDSWQPSYARRSSTDRGHIHASCRSDVLTSPAADDYDPVARIRAGKGAAMAARNFGFPGLDRYTDSEKLNLLLLNYGPEEPDFNGLAQATQGGAKAAGLVLEQVTALRQEVGNLATAPGGAAEQLDYERLADLVVDRLAARLQTPAGT